MITIQKNEELCSITLVTRLSSISLSTIFQLGLTVLLCFSFSISILGQPDVGLEIDTAGIDGIRINSAGDDGIQIENSRYGAYIYEPSQEGIHITRAGEDGIFLNGSGGNGIVVTESTKVGVYIYDVETNGIVVEDSGEDGIKISGTGGDGISVVNTTGIAADLHGNVHVSDTLDVTGFLSKGGGSFKIDHPLHPESHYLYHSFVESPDMMNVYNGNITTDHAGHASVAMPDYFDVLNRDFRYQLTVIGAFAQAIIKKKLKDNQFVIQTDQPKIEVSWQITGIRQDQYAEQNRIEVEVEKEEKYKGRYLHHEAYDMPFEKGHEYVNLDYKTLAELQAEKQEQKNEGIERRKDRSAKNK